jgi:quinoprotein glucose dehydrogenase
MRNTIIGHNILAVVAGMSFAALLTIATAQAVERGTTNGEWRSYGGDLASTKYAPLDQINAENFDQLELAWRFRTHSLGPTPETNFQATPLMVDGVVYTVAGSRRSVVALDAVTGELLWMHREDEGARGAAAPRRLSGRGLSYWSDGDDARIVYVTPGYRMLALDAETGIPVAEFGDNGVVDLKLEADQEMDLVTGEMGLHATPLIADNVIVVGAAHLTGSQPVSRRNEKGFIRGYDARTGKRLWIFHTIPMPDEFGYDTWAEGSATYTGNTGVWSEMSADAELGLAYLPVEQPTGDYYGGHRHGDGLFGESIVAVDLHTGEYRWHFQLVHHGIWDFDIPSAPILADIVVEGREIQALIQPTKQSWLYVFDRATGEPVWPIEERPVEQTDVPFEQTSPTQPFVTWPPPFDRQGVSHDDLIDFTPELRAEAIELVSRYKIGPLFTPPVVSRWEGPLATLMLPSTVGGANWPGGAYDPNSGLLYIQSSTAVTPLGLVPPQPGQSDMGYIRGTVQDPASGKVPSDGRPVPTVQGLPLIKPPYGRITAFDMNTGQIAWQTVHGDTPDEVKNHPLLEGIDIPRTGRPGRGGVLATSTLLIAGESGFVTTPYGRGAMMRAYDKATGDEHGAVFMPAPQTGAPMTYMADGKQYVVVAVSGPEYGAELLAYALPTQE